MEDGHGFTDETIKINNGKIKYNINFVFRFSYDCQNGIYSSKLTFNSIKKTMKNNTETIDLELENNKELISTLKDFILHNFSNSL